MKPFNSVQRIAILVCKQICFIPFKNVYTEKLFNYKSYVYLFKCENKRLMLNCFVI